MIGRTLGNYRIIEQIGLGGMATVFKGYDPDTDRYVAIKILPQHFSHDPQFRERFKREAKAIARLEHLHILPIFTYGEEDGIAYMAMRYLQGGTLTDRIGLGALPLAEASQILRQLANALDHAHSQNILHRDMKPSNVLLDEAGNAYLMDFGIAKIVEATIDLTGDRLLGTPAYMSPEQCKGEPIGPASDIYSLGIILYEMVTGRRPFHAETPVAVILQQLNNPLPPPRQIRPDLPEQAENVIFKALAKNPESRYKSAVEFADAFSQAIATADTAVALTRPAQPSTSTPLPPTEQITLDTAVAPPTKRRFPTWAWGLIGILAAAILVTLGAFLANPAGEDKPPAPTNTLAAAAPATAVPTDEKPEPAESHPTMPLPAVPKCAPEQKELFFDDFEDGNFDGWELLDDNGQPSTAGWHVLRQDDNHVLVGTNHNWAYAPAAYGQDYALHFRVRALSPEANWHTNVRVGDGRYFIAVDSLNRDLNNEKLSTWPYNPDDRWHVISIIVIGNHLEVLWDGNLKTAVDDPNPIKAGIIAIENLEETVWYDDIRVCALPTAEQPTIQPSLESPTAILKFAQPYLDVATATEPDYEDMFDDPNSGWGSSQADLEGWGYEDGQFVQWVNQPDTTINVFHPALADYSDFVLAADVTFLDGDTGSAYVIFRGVPGDGRYALQIWPNENVKLVRELENGQDGGLAGGLPRTQPRLGQTDRLQIIARGKQIAILINDEPLWLAEDDTFSRGEIGLQIRTTDGPLHVAWNNLRIWEIE